MNYLVEYREDLKIIGYYTEDSVDELKDKSFIKINEEMYRYLRNLEQQGDTFLALDVSPNTDIKKEYFCIKETKNVIQENKNKFDTLKDEFDKKIKELEDLKIVVDQILTENLKEAISNV